METYYEVQCGDNAVQVFHNLEDAIAHADANGYKLISEIGGSWTEYEKCEWCEEWYDSNDIGRTGICYRCERAIEDHNGPQD